MRQKTRLPGQRTRRASFPVTVTRLPVVTCSECGQSMAHQPGPGNAAAVLTEHYSRDHTLAAESP